MFYDLVLTSPPYYKIEEYSHQENKTTLEWTEWYNLLFTKIYKHLQPNGIMALNINEAMYNDKFIPLFGLCDNKFELKKRSEIILTLNIFIYGKNKNKAPIFIIYTA